MAYAKNAEDEFLIGLIDGLSIRRRDIPELAVEFGALDGKRNSTTRLLLEEHPHWHGLWIEPGPLYPKLVENAAGMPNVETGNYAISDRDGTVDFFLREKQLGWSSIVPREHRTGKPGKAPRHREERQVQVPCKQLCTVLGDRPVGLMVIDVEGWEVPILRNMMLTGVNPAVLMAEWGDAQEQYMQEQLLAQRYKLLRCGPANNNIYVRRDVLSQE